MKAYKGFTKDLKCRDFQFEEGKTYEEDDAKLCERGFHACLNPMDCWRYYGIIDNVYHEVELEGVSEECQKEDSKIVARKITVGAKLDIAGMVKGAIDFVFSAVKERKDNSAQMASSGYNARMASSGYNAQLASSGYYAQMTSSGNSAQIDMQGEHVVGAAIGPGSIIRGKIGSWITLAEYDEDNNPICVKSAQIDGEKLKPDTWYRLEDGEFVEVED